MPRIPRYNREFREPDVFTPFTGIKRAHISRSLAEIPRQIEPGNFCCEPGNLGKVEGILWQRLGRPARATKMQSPTPSPTLREGNLAVPVQVATTRFFIYEDANRRLCKMAFERRQRRL